MAPLATGEVVLQQVDIADDDELFERYGLLIPVLRRIDIGQELNWPFDQQQVLDLLQG